MAGTLISLERIQKLLATKFCKPWNTHPGMRDNCCNLFCLDCCGGSQHALCRWCVFNHAGGSHHRMLQIRKCSLHEAVRCHDLDGLLDVSGIQKYIINNGYVFYLKPRPFPGKLTKDGKQRRGMSSPFSCYSCQRALIGVARFCSIACKVYLFSHPKYLILPPAHWPHFPLLDIAKLY
ncbi:hypothetical protein C2845_PM10G12710 [Panicum miliaceum]|uniref:B box-type domain-containing protein n=1 Tax=Panicum miliaceum TaxID=4540 RepID=A0A3L6PFM0_PANMI|nr:hypothetical protein C2845_PM10G12710 [Panicum miliaceum]